MAREMEKIGSVSGMVGWEGWVGGLGGKVGLGEGEVGTDDEAWWLEDRLGVMYLEWGRY